MGKTRRIAFIGKRGQWNVRDRHMDDDKLLSRWIAGDQWAAQLLERYRKPLLRFFRARCALSSEDLVQETFAALISARDRFRRDSSVRTFLFMVARNVLYATRRRERITPCTPFDVDELTCEPNEETPTLDNALLQLDMELRQVLRLFYWSDMCTREIADLLDIPEGTVSSRLRRAREQLRRHLVTCEAEQQFVRAT